VNAIQKSLSGLKNVLKKPLKAFQGFGSGSTKLHPKLVADTLLDLPSIADKMKHKVRKAFV
jgi:hypothetical protein